MSYWIEWKWTPEKPYPETLGTMFEEIKYRDGTIDTNHLTVEEWYANGEGNLSHEFPTPIDIVAYKVSAK